MRKLCISGILVSLILFVDCEKRLYHFVSPIEHYKTFELDQNGPFEGTAKIMAAEIKSALGVPTEARITGLDIETLKMRVDPLSGNQATLLYVSGYVKDQGQNILMFQDQEVPLRAVDNPIFGVNTYIREGIQTLSRKLNDHISGVNNADIDIEFKGDSWPTGGQHINVYIQFYIVATVKYDECLPVPPFMDGESCDW